MIYLDASGYRYEVTDPTTDPVKFFAQGGGFEETMPRLKFHARFTLEATPPTWRPGTVTAEWFYTDNGQGKGYPCWSTGDLWNGWGMPAFTRATIDEMLIDFDTSGFSEKVRWVDGKLQVTDDGEEYILDPITIPGVDEPLYALGAGCWTWDAVQFKDLT